MTRTIACYSSKGGVGKTAASVNLAYASAATGKRTLLIDLDQQGASTFYFRVRAPKRHRAKALMSDQQAARASIRETDYVNLHLLPAHVSYRNFDALLDGMKRSKSRLADFVDEVGAGYQRIILDCPPTLSLVAENIFRAADRIIVPVVPTTLSERTYEQLKDFFERSNFKMKKLRPFFSMVDRRKRMHHETILLMRSNEKRMLESEIPYSSAVEAMGVQREPLLSYAPGHIASLAFQALWDEIEAL
ncbi:ParA family protein [Coraliomargarita akajimensis]|uniref:Cobyrinic acid ac-diamide synthase n=1 Tax=Coraliomargarita akajimensis (strain DSM 45221 / IAM 15411 / JCM 23193 / KCTC 12865 / 04OKA010-24) TaxID=583355 RepID=D5EJB4_CORAD|nr:AAA family ATPase [Coraliomargarita akajimensis]ADE54513.1 Cobyrinic acid ac-diamide synthase [Coraliomargarita akajimensis DSM 45221]